MALRLNIEELEDPTHRFDYGSPSATHGNVGKGLSRYGPLDSQHNDWIDDSTLTVVYPEQWQSEGERLINVLKNGYEYFGGGFERFFKLDEITINGLEMEGDSVANYKEAAEEVVRRNLDGVAIFLTAERMKRLGQVSPYWIAKAKLTEQGIPTQMMRVGNIEDDYDLKYAIVNTVCQIYAKLGGKPWGVEETGYNADLVVGIGRSYYQPEKHGSLERTLGFAAAYQSNGSFFWFDSETSGGDVSELETKLTDTICNVVDEYVKREQPPRRIIIHTPERIGDTERSARRKIEDEYDNTEVVLLHLNTTHPYKTHDPNHSSGLPEPGWFLQTGYNKGLVVTDGRKRFRNGSASPIAMRVEGIEEITRDDMVGLAQNTFSLCSVYWKDQMGAGTPITLRYAKDIAELFEASQYLAREKVISLNPNQLVNDRLQDRPWFL